METIEIPLNKQKILLLIFGAATLVAVGVLFIINPVEFEGRRASKEMIFIIGIAAVLFFGICLVFAIRKLFSKQVGLMINSDGLIDNSAGNSAGQILWTDVKGITIYNVMNQKFVSVHVKDPEKYISAQKNVFKRKLMAQNYKMAGTPISISPNTLKISFNELHSLLQDRFGKYKQSQNQSTLQ